jgi:hypothetical protein
VNDRVNRAALQLHLELLVSLYSPTVDSTTSRATSTEEAEMQITVEWSAVAAWTEAESFWQSGF